MMTKTKEALKLVGEPDGSLQDSLEEHIKALVDNRAYPKLTPASNKLEAVLSLIASLENQVGGMPVLGQIEDQDYCLSEGSFLRD